MKNSEWVIGLRALADWLEQNPDLSVGAYIGTVHPFRTCKDATVAEARRLAADNGFDTISEDPDEIDGVIREVGFARSFGPLTVEIWGEDTVSEEWLEQHRVRRPRLRELIKAVFS